MQNIMLDDFMEPGETKPGRKRLYGTYTKQPEVNKPVIVKDEDSSEKRIVMLTSDGHLRCCGSVRKIGPEMFYWQGLAGADGRRKTEWEAFMALGYNYINDDHIEVIRGRTAIVQVRAVDSPPIETNMTEPATNAACAIDKQLKMIRVGDKVRIVGHKDERVKKEDKMSIGVITKITNGSGKNCLVFFKSSSEKWFSGKQLEVIVHQQ